ncbi:hypothetical protein [Mycobacterium sp. DL592]|uniref:hypothetical protein n=1 Tax=Mycobacterium sp. DL592 TaxID=2675524 RepID=UPI001423E1EF|nr:hypothetical protein [Mycobacterium sp. DL592]
MQALLRSKVTEGAALLTAGAIALSPIVIAPAAEHLPALRVSSIATTLTGSADPITTWVDVLNTTFNNIAALGGVVQADPSPILSQLVTNQLAYAQTIATALSQAGGSLVAGITSIPQALLTAGQQLAAGQISAATQTVWQAGLGLVLAPVISLLPVFNIPGQIAQNVANVLTALPNALLPIGLAALNPIAGVVAAVGDTGQAIYDALSAGNITAALGAIVNAPAVFTNAFLNGYAPQGTTGILSVGTDFAAGLVNALLNVRDTIAKAIAAPAPVPLSAAPAAAVPALKSTVTVTTAAPAAAAETQTDAADTPATSSGGTKTRAATTDPAGAGDDSPTVTTPKSVGGVNRSRGEARGSHDASRSAEKTAHAAAAGGSGRSTGE